MYSGQKVGVCIFCNFSVLVNRNLIYLKGHLGKMWELKKFPRSDESFDKSVVNHSDTLNQTASFVPRKGRDLSGMGTCSGLALSDYDEDCAFSC